MVDEIVVVGRRTKIEPGPLPYYVTPGGSTRTRSEREGLSRAFLAPAATPALEEIIVTASRKGTVRIAAGRAAAAFGWMFGALIGVYELDRYRQQIEREADEKSKREAELQRQRRLANEQPLPEIVVTAPRALQVQAAPSPYYVPQVQPLITPDVDPGVMVPFLPQPMPQPEVLPSVPEVEIAPVPAPVIPRVQPATAPRPGVLPQFLPYATPYPMPIPGVMPRPATTPQPSRRVQPQPRPMTQPAARPGSQVNPAIRTGTLTRTQSGTLSLPQISEEGITQQSECPPCAKDEEREKPRSQCWRKLVKEGLYPSMDTEYQWVEIDCFTQREL